MVLDSNSNLRYKNFFGENKPLNQASATGRLDVMGGIADYSGSMVLQLPIKEKTTVTISQTQHNRLKIKSLSIDQDEVLIDIDELPTNYLEANQYLKSIFGSDWISYIVGCFLVIQNEKNIKLGGLDILIESNIPLGKGVSSSAALEVATLKAIANQYHLDFIGTELPKLAQKAENLVVGAPCGLMDQLASYFGKENHLLPILCQPDIIFDPIELPPNLFFFGIDSGVRHSVGGVSYSEVRTASSMGFSTIVQKTGYSFDNTSNLPFGGFLSNIPPSLYESKFSKYLTSTYGKNFLRENFTVFDPLSIVNPDSLYHIKACTEHPIYENERVKTFISLLKNLNNDNFEEILQLMGELMYQSHESYNKCNLGNQMTDKIVEMAREKGFKSGIYGAKITGGGSGGTVCILAYGEQGEASVSKLFKEYQTLTGFQNLHLFR